MHFLKMCSLHVILALMFAKTTTKNYTGYILMTLCEFRKLKSHVLRLDGPTKVHLWERCLRSGCL